MLIARSGAVTCANSNGPIAHPSMVACTTSVLGLRCPCDISQYVFRVGQAQTRLPKGSVW
jgi:hypothetical protein